MMTINYKIDNLNVQKFKHQKIMIRYLYLLEIIIENKNSQIILNFQLNLSIKIDWYLNSEILRIK